MVLNRKKLLVLDLNGLLLATYPKGKKLPDHPHDARVKKYRVYKRPGCEDFLQFCLENFVVGVWSSAQEDNVVALVDYLFQEFVDKEARSKLVFVWHQSQCSKSKFRDPENTHKPVYLKELVKLWDKVEPHLPWEKGDYGPSNTVLIDDSPQKAIRNPPYTAIFPDSYKAIVPEDIYLLAGGQFRTYLEGLATAANVQVYLKENPFGKPSIIPESLLRGFARASITEGGAKSTKKVAPTKADVVKPGVGTWKTRRRDRKVLTRTNSVQGEANMHMEFLREEYRSYKCGYGSKNAAKLVIGC
ncbi:hypothetical protein R1flu_003507 [Riccia fluitans]|uniref:Mitochondrial import inner membrane translocase subunit TIM50 n=1 Tax=Riccia fluitans TaxID=41844 RepID=A0ABD1YC97_9MARC